MPRLQRNHFPWLSMTDVIFHDFPGLESSLIKFHDFPWLVLHHIYMQDNKGDLRNEIKHKYHHCDKKLAHLQRELIVCCASSSRMRVMNHNWSATKQRLQPQSVAEISRHSVLSGDRIRHGRLQLVGQIKKFFCCYWEKMPSVKICRKICK